MARPRSEEKRTALLEAAVRVIAERGLAGTPTSAISAAAGVAEGTLFTYFKTKDELVNALYLTLKEELAETLMQGFSPRAGVRRQFQYLWDNYVDWGVGNQEKKRVLDQLTHSTQVTAAARQQGTALFENMLQLVQDSIDAGVLKDFSVPFIASAMASLAEMTMGFIIQDPQGATGYRKSGFAIWWSGIAVQS